VTGVVVNGCGHPGRRWLWRTFVALFVPVAGVHWAARYSNHNRAGERLERLHRAVAELPKSPATACAAPAAHAADAAHFPEPLGDVEQLRATLEECGSVAELSRRSGQPATYVRALLEAEGMIGPKLRRGSLSDEQLRRAGRDYEAGATLRELAKSYGVGKTYLRQHLIRAGVQMRPTGVRPEGRDQPQESPSPTPPASARFGALTAGYTGCIARK
jgi:hypothetical protein